MDDTTRNEPLSYPVVGCKVRIPWGTEIVASTDPNAPNFSRSTTQAPVVHIEPQADGTEWIWWSASRSALRAAVWTGDQFRLVEGWVLKSFYRKPPKPKVHKCPRCAAVIPRPVLNQKYCSARCQRAAAKARAAARGYYKPCPVRGCRRRGFCAKHYPNSHRARAEYWGVKYEPIIATQVFDRDGWVCGLCSYPVDPSLTRPDVMSVSLDHIVPLSRGGDHLWANVQCAHLICNIRKGNRTARPAALQSSALVSGATVATDLKMAD